jgi:hypothetical protein
MFSIILQTDLPTPAMEAMRLGAYIKVLGNEMNFVSADRQTLLELIDTGEF